jgi:hypothetical protein
MIRLRLKVYEAGFPATNSPGNRGNGKHRSFDTDPRLRLQLRSRQLIVIN